MLLCKLWRVSHATFIGFLLLIKGSLLTHVRYRVTFVSILGSTLSHIIHPSLNFGFIIFLTK